MMFYDPTWRINTKTPSLRGVVVEPNSGGGRTCAVSVFGKTITANVAGSRQLFSGEPVSIVLLGDNSAWAIQVDKSLSADYPSRFPRPLSEWAKKAPASLFLRYAMRDNPKFKTYRQIKVSAFDSQSGVAAFEDGSAPVRFGTDAGATVAPGESTLLYDDGTSRHVIGNSGDLGWTDWGGEISLGAYWGTGVITDDIPVTIRVGQECALTYFQTYHWTNPGTPETMVLIHTETGRQYGPIPVTHGPSNDSYGNVVPNAVWYCTLPEGQEWLIRIPAGTYTIRYSNRVTTSNTDMWYRPMMVARGRLKRTVSEVKTLYNNYGSRLYPTSPAPAGTVTFSTKVHITRIDIFGRHGVEAAVTRNTTPDKRYSIGFSRYATRYLFDYITFQSTPYQVKIRAEIKENEVNQYPTITSQFQYEVFAYDLYGQAVLTLEAGTYEIDFCGFTDLSVMAEAPHQNSASIKIVGREET